MFLEFLLASLLTLWGIYELYILIKTPQKLKLVDIILIILCLSFGISPYMAFYYGHIFQDYSLTVTIITYAGIFLFILGLKLSTKIKIFSKENDNLDSLKFTSIFENYKQINAQLISLLLIISFILRLTYLLDNNLFFYGDDSDIYWRRMEHINYAWIIVNSFVIVVQYTILMWAFLIIINKDKKYSRFLVYTIVLTHFFFSFQSRGFLFIMLVFYFMALIIQKRITRKILYKYILATLFFFFIISPFITNLRNNFKVERSGNFFSVISTSLLKTFEQKKGTIYNNYRANISSRIYIVRWNKYLIQRQESHGYLLGSVLTTSFFQVIPKALLLNKYSLTSAEYLYKKKYNMINTDISENLPYLSYMEFGLLGNLLYGILFGIIYNLIDLKARKYGRKSKIIGIVIISGVLWPILLFETTFVAIFASLRDTILLVTILIILKKLSQKIYHTYSHNIIPIDYSKYK